MASLGSTVLYSPFSHTVLCECARVTYMGCVPLHFTSLYCFHLTSIPHFIYMPLYSFTLFHSFLCCVCVCVCVSFHSTCICIIHPHSSCSCSSVICHCCMVLHCPNVHLYVCDVGLPCLMGCVCDGMLCLVGCVCVCVCVCVMCECFIAFWPTSIDF